MRFLMKLFMRRCRLDGQRPDIVPGLNGFIAACPGCGKHTLAHSTMSQAVNAWNDLNGSKYSSSWEYGLYNTQKG